ncbi:MAG: hypothetical protein GWP91_01250 [Rhodobacterales bacterium]|nr:hypothetical protein [Rhodobacterales bacterium]
MSTFIQRQDFLELAVFLQPLLLEWRRSMRVLSGLFVAVEPELPFGIESAAASERPGVAHLLASHLSLPSGDRPVRGKADRVMVFLGNGESVAEILDYKTGAAKSKRALCEGMQTLELPQLPIYALALRNALKAAAAAGESHILDLPVDTVVRSLGYDFAKNAGKGGLLDDFLIDDADLNAYETAIDTLVVAAERGRWALHPLKDDEMGRASWGFPRGIVSLREASRYEGPPGTRPSLEDPSSDEQTSEGGTQ